jgi:hypothetical protein
MLLKYGIINLRIFIYDSSVAAAYSSPCFAVFGRSSPGFKLSDLNQFNHIIGDNQQGKIHKSVDVVSDPMLGAFHKLS